ncbi:MAG: hypothetical protein IH597_04500 [Bacteroidales bacterium]|nr:hypothetical protein [Bacteroidales bacterium]
MMRWIVPKASSKVVKHANDPENAELLDVHPFWFTEAEAMRALQAMGEQGRQHYIRFHKREDLLFPFVYGSFLAFSLFLLNRKRFQKHRFIYLIPAVPLLAMMADLVENHHIVLLTGQFPDLNSGTLKIAAIANSIKWSSVSLSLLLIAMFVVIHAVGMFRRNDIHKSDKNTY